MTATLRIKRRAAGGAAGAPSSLAAAEMAFNEQDNILYYGKGNSGGNATSILPIAGPGAFAPLNSPVFTGNPTAPTPTAGDNDTSLATTAFVTTAIAAVGGGTPDIPQAGRLTYVSATALKFAPYRGNKIKINGTVYTISNSGIAGLANTSVFVNGVAGQNLAANTTYYVYAFNNSGTVTANFRTDGNGHITDTTSGNEGVEVRCSSGTTPDPTRTLIGLIRTNASSQFTDSTTQRFVRSWFNASPATMVNAFTTTRWTDSAFLVEINSEIRVEWVNFAGEAIALLYTGMCYQYNGVVSTLYHALSIDGTTGVNGISIQSYADAHLWPVPLAVNTKPTEGYHYATKLGACNSGWLYDYTGDPSFCTLTGTLTVA
jgi:hypothetical protein